MPPFDGRVLVRPPFSDAEFTATKWDSSADKARFANALCRFIAEDFPEKRWTQKLYRRLSLTYGMIAHYDSCGFWAEYFTGTEGKITFLQDLLSYPCYGQPDHTYCDVERAVAARLRQSGILPAYRALRLAEIEASERAVLARLRSKYDGAPAVTPPPALVMRPITPAHRRTSAAPEEQSSLL